MSPEAAAAVAGGSIRANVGGREWVYQYGREVGSTEPTDRQAIAHQLWAKERLYGGAAGGGKTDWLLAEVIRCCLTWGVHGLILRRQLRDMDQPEGIIPRLLQRIPRWVARYNANKHSWQFPNGATLALGYFRTDADVQQYMGGEVGIVAWDQLEQFTEWMFRRMFHPLRGQPPAEIAAANALAGLEPFEPCMVASANPGGLGHVWVKDRYIDPAPPEIVWKPSPTEDEADPGTRVFIPALPADNPHLTDYYLHDLDNLPADDRRALKHGDWDVYAGARFRMFRRHIHVIEPDQWPVPEGIGVPKALGVDYGSAAPFCGLWGALFPDGLVVVYREAYRAELSPAEQAEYLRGLERPAGERTSGRPMPTYLDPSCWMHNPDDPRAPLRSIGVGEPAPGGSIADTYRRNGVQVQKANNDRLSGTARIAEKLKLQRDRRPRLLIYSTCTNLLRTLPGIPRDKHNPELYDTNAEDHAVDALRYLLMGLDPGGDGMRARTNQAPSNPSGYGVPAERMGGF